MAIDLYSLCPCGSGKKIKFCCRDLAGEIEKIERMLEAGQRQACLEHIEILDKKYPGRPYLVTTKAELQRELGRGDEADATLKELLSHEGGNPVARAEAALQALERQDETGVPEAVQQLQLAIEAAGDQWPERVFEALVAVANHSVAQGRWMTGLGHMMLFAAADPNDEQSRQAIMQFHRSPRVPLIVKEDRWLKDCSADVPWKSRFEEALDLAHSGLWNKAEHEFAQLAEEHPTSPVLWHNLALLRAWLADDTGAAAALRAYSRLDVPLDDAIEALVLAFELAPSLEDQNGELVRATWTVNDMDRVIAVLNSDPRLIDRGPQPPDAQEENSGPPPRAEFIWLDQAPPAASPDLTLKEVPVVVGSLALFGRETDREPRLEALGLRNEAWEACQGALNELLGDAAARGEDNVVSTVPTVLLRQKRRFVPEGVAVEHQERLRAEGWRAWMLDEWPRQSNPFLGGKTPEEAAGDDSQHIALAATILTSELATNAQNVMEFDFNQVRQRVGLPPCLPLPKGETPIGEIPLARLSRAPFAELSREELISIYMRATHYDAMLAAYRAGMELVERGAEPAGETDLSQVPDSRAELQLDVLSLVLSEFAADTATSLQWIDRSRRIALDKGRTCAQQDLMEMMLRVRRGEPDQFTRLLEHVSEDHIDEPNVRQSLAKILIAIGAVNPDGTPTARAAAASRAESAAQGPSQLKKLWTPGGGEPAAAGEPQKIWTPG